MSEIALEALKDEAYRKFITEAFKRSSYATYIVRWPSEKFEFFDKKEYIELGFTVEFYEYMYQLREKEYIESKRIFNSICLPFLKSLEPYYVNNQKLSKAESKYRVRLTPEIFELFLKPESLDNWRFPRYPDDLCFVADNKYWFLSEAHGQPFAVLHPNSEEDYHFWSKNGIVFMYDFDVTADVTNRPQV